MDRSQLFLSSLTLSLFLSPTLLNAAPIIQSEGAEVVANEYIIILKDQQFDKNALTLNNAESISDIATRLIGEANSLSIQSFSSDDSSNNSYERVYEHSIKGFSATLSDEALELIASKNEVARIMPNTVVTLDGSGLQQGATWGLDRIDHLNLPLDSTYKYDYTGKNVHAYIIDTGLKNSHNEFSGRVGEGFNAVDNNSDTSDCHGHGTHVAGTVAGTKYGVAKEATIHSVKVFGCSGSTTAEIILSGVDWVAANHQSPAVANMSLGGYGQSAYNQAIEKTVDKGVVFAVAAGNDYAQNACNYSPAMVPTVITVGATTNRDQRSSFSNTGSCVDIFAPGTNITSAGHRLDTGSATMSGTSMASPHVAGAAAMCLEAYPQASAADIKELLKINAAEDKITSLGTDSPNLLLQNRCAKGGNSEFFGIY